MAVKSISQRNKQHKEKQKFPHRMGPINFGRVRVAMRATKETNKEPKKEDFQHRQAAGETEEEAFEALFGKEQPGRIRVTMKIKQ
ncbi:hypothetical protein Ahy_A02g006802 [Arachis hypogaea]|uniref:Uncharacterized protein n=1 Tax=Arachis hypogaea TaxID=3818 RepID=A0A445EB87_ARAHY|nr:hypothetical protein Ahy_A02g006802 [Arachis hypogaea]